MSDHGDGTPPPPPPYGGGSGGDQNQPPQGQPYGAPPPQGEPFGAPPSGDPYAQPPAYGAPAPDPYAQPSAYGAQPPGYGAQPPGYGQQPPAYGQQPPAYGQQPPAYGQPGYGAASPPPYGAAPYGQQYPAYGAPGGVPGGTPGGLASMGKRFGARAIDAVLYGIVGTIAQSLIVGSLLTDPVTIDENGQLTGGTGFFAGFFAYIFVVAIFGILYEVIMIALKGATLGKMAVGIKVVREADGGLPGWGPSALRWIIPQVAGWVSCGLGGIVVYLSPFWDNAGRQQGWHDKVAKTLVVNN
jgi:uncharacterized RDD family membrane protein YckC